MSKLTAVKVRNAKAKDRPYKLSDGHGMYLHVATSGLKTWRYRFRINHKESTFTLGEFPAMPLADARVARMEAREKVKRGINPAADRRMERQAVREHELQERERARNTFENISLEWLEKQRGGWSTEHANAVLATLKADVFPAIGAQAIDKISPPQVLAVLETIQKRGALEIASKVLQRMSAVFRYAVQTGRATYNPAADMRGVIKKKKVQHLKSLPDGNLPQFLKDLTASDRLHIITRLAFHFLILTTVRTKNVREVEWEDIDLEGRLWSIPAGKMKARVAHRVPLSRQAVAILERMGRMYGKQGLVFPGIRQGSKQFSENTLTQAVYRLGYKGKCNPHGFRTNFSNIANESGKWSADAIERALAHREKNQVRAAYHRTDYLEQRKELMQWWADLLQKMEYGAEIISFSAIKR